MERTLIRDLRKVVGQEVRIQGWLQTSRNTKGAYFLVVRDHTGQVQIVVDKSGGTPHPTMSRVNTLTRESAVSVAQREHRYDVLVKQSLEKGLTLEPIQFYLDFFKFGCPPHGGLGLGLTRLLMIMLGHSSVREVIYLYRNPSRLHP